MCKESKRYSSKQFLGALFHTSKEKILLVIRLILESFRFAWSALKMNVLRTVLSLLGVTIGIFAIITVLTFVDSLESNIRDSLSFLGAGVIYVNQSPWAPDANGEYRWWDYIRRPKPSYGEFKFLEKKLNNRESIAIFSGKGNVPMKQRNNSMGDGTLFGVSYQYNRLFEFEFRNGRYFTEQEIDGGRNVAILGYTVAKSLFPNTIDPIGKTLKIKNLKYTVIGTLTKEGESFLGSTSNDEKCIIPYHSFRKLYTTGTGNKREVDSVIGLKGRAKDIGLVELENELLGLMRSRRGLKPKEKPNFAMNRPEAITNILDGLFNGLTIAGWVIGGFSILVGGFGIANIMFVSVKERTNIIGIQKALGAKNYFVLFQFLFESIFLSIIGGITGIALVVLVTFIPMGSLQVALTFQNIVIGIGVSVFIGTLSGIIPAAMAARLDPVIAIRSS